MSNDDIIIDLVGAVNNKPNEGEIARRGSRRMVKLVPVPGMYAVPCIWAGPVKPAEIDPGKYVLSRECIILMSKDPLQSMKMTIPADFYEKLPEIPVEW